MTDTATFTGFPPEALKFLADIKENNNKEWFEANKPIYQDFLVAPAVDFVAAMGSRLQDLSPDINFDMRTNGSGSLMRFYRDTRFSKDKSPYKTAIAGMFWQGAKKKGSPGYGFHLQSDEMWLMAGKWGFEKELLEAFREAVDDDKMGKALLEAIAKVEAAGDYTVKGDHYKRVPRGFDADHPRADLLRFNHLMATPPAVPAKDVLSGDLVEISFAHFKAMSPIQEWLAKVAERV